MKVFVLLSECGMNGVVIHGVYSAKPNRQTVRQKADEVKHYTGYLGTFVEDHELHEEGPGQ